MAKVQKNASKVLYSTSLTLSWSYSTLTWCNVLITPGWCRVNTTMGYNYTALSVTVTSSLFPCGARVGSGCGPNKKKGQRKIKQIKRLWLAPQSHAFFFFSLKCLRIWILLVVKKALSCFKGCNDHCLIFVSNMFETLCLSTYIHLDHQKRTDYGGWAKTSQVMEVGFQKVFFVVYFCFEFLMISGFIILRLTVSMKKISVTCTPCSHFTGV